MEKLGSIRKVIKNKESKVIHAPCYILVLVVNCNARINFVAAVYIGLIWLYKRRGENKLIMMTYLLMT